MFKKLLILAPLLVAGWCFLAPEQEMPTQRLATDELVATISHGESVDLQAHLEPGKWTLIEFGAKWCPACTELGPQVEALVNEKATVRLRHIDIGTWESDVARENNIRRLPTLALYNGTHLVSQDTQRVLQMLRKP